MNRRDLFRRLAAMGAGAATVREVTTDAGRQVVVVEFPRQVTTELVEHARRRVREATGLPDRNILIVDGGIKIRFVGGAPEPPRHPELPDGWPVATREGRRRRAEQALAAPLSPSVLRTIVDAVEGNREGFRTRLVAALRKEGGTS